MLATPRRTLTVAVALAFAPSVAPAAAGVVRPAAPVAPAFQHGLIPRVLTPAQAAGLRPTALAPWVRLRPDRFAPSGQSIHGVYGAKAAPTTLWVTDDYEIYEINDKGTKVLATFTDCSGPEGIKVDHSRNVWVACTNSGTVNMYAPGATKATLTLVDNPGGVAYDTVDVAVDGAGNVYASSLYAYQCNKVKCYFDPGEISYWTASNVRDGASPSGVVNDGNLTDMDYFLDVDAAGNIYTDYDNCGSSSSCTYDVDKIANPQAPTPTITTLLNSLQFPGGIYVSKSTKYGTLNVGDQGANVISQYALPTPLGSPVVLGPVGSGSGSSSGSCSGSGSGSGPGSGGEGPVGFGWLAKDTQVAVAVCSSLVVGHKPFPPGVFVARPQPAYVTPIGAAYNPSDK